MFAKCFARIIFQYVPEGSGSWKYNHYFPVAKGKGKMWVIHCKLKQSVNLLMKDLLSLAVFNLVFFTVLFPVYWANKIQYTMNCTSPNSTLLLYTPCLCFTLNAPSLIRFQGNATWTSCCLSALFT